jgi:hypothetical protein
MVPPKDMRKSGLEVSELNTSNTKEGMTQSPVSRVPSPDDGQKKNFYADIFYTALGITTGYAGTIVIAKVVRAVREKAK